MCRSFRPSVDQFKSKFFYFGMFCAVISVLCGSQLSVLIIFVFFVLNFWFSVLCDSHLLFFGLDQIVTLFFFVSGFWLLASGCFRCFVFVSCSFFFVFSRFFFFYFPICFSLFFRVFPFFCGMRWTREIS